ncbi:MAG TPA: hypothetical protein VFP87_12005 [Chitinophagaceae bacterium]|nr:hypothetical protein [Chitinophagaceae bacterium]
MISKVKVVTKQVSESATAASEKSNHKSDPFTCFRADRRVIKIMLDDILYIESLRDYISHTIQKHRHQTVNIFN